MFGIHRNRLEPVRHSLAQIFLKKSLALDSIRIASQNQSPIAQKRQNEVSRAVVISQQVSLGVAGFGEIHFVQIAQTEPFAVQFDGRGFRAPLEQLVFDLGFCVEHAANNLGRANHDRGGRISGGNLVFPLAICGTRVLAERQENRVTQSVLLRPSTEFDTRHQSRRDPRWFFICFRPKSSEPKGRAEVRASVQPPTTASTVLVIFSFTQYGLRSETYGPSARLATIPSRPFCSASVNNSFPCSN